MTTRRTITITVDYAALLNARVALELMSADAGYRPEREKLAADKRLIDDAVYEALSKKNI